MQLPDALQPWHEWLSWFEPPIAASVGSMLHRLHPLLGKFGGNQLGGEPEPQGLEDLRSRGSYERLLASEWLLADEVPDEFLRRAVSGEHTFLAPRVRARNTQRICVALFDCGPFNLGAPRLVHIAMWILLARRAAQANVELRWGTLQSPGVLRAATTADELKALISARTFELSTPDHLSQWCVALREASLHAGECWLIGDAPAVAETEGLSISHRVAVLRDTQQKNLEVTLKRRHAVQRIELAIPSPLTVAPLLRCHFKGDAALALQGDLNVAYSRQRPPIISYHGERIAVALRDAQGALCYVVRQGGMKDESRPRLHRWNKAQSALAMTIATRQPGILLTDSEQLRFFPTRMVIAPNPTQEIFHAPGSTAGWLPMAWLRDSERQRVYVIDQSRRLLYWDGLVELKKKQRVTKAAVKHDQGAINRLELLGSHGLALAQRNAHSVTYAYWANDRIWMRHLRMDGWEDKAAFVGEAPDDAVVLLGGSATVWRHGCAIRVSRNPDVWAVSGAAVKEEAFRVTLPESIRALGLARDMRDKRLGLVTVSTDALQMHYSDGSSDTLYQAGPISTSSICPNSGLVAMVTHAGELIAYSASWRELRLHKRPVENAYAAN